MCKTTLLMKKSAWEPEGSCQAGGCVRVHVRVCVLGEGYRGRLVVCVFGHGYILSFNFSFQQQKMHAIGQS